MFSQTGNFQQQGSGGFVGSGNGDSAGFGFNKNQSFNSRPTGGSNSLPFSSYNPFQTARQQQQQQQQPNTNSTGPINPFGKNTGTVSSAGYSNDNNNKSNNTRQNKSRRSKNMSMTFTNGVPNAPNNNIFATNNINKNNINSSANNNNNNTFINKNNNPFTQPRFVNNNNNSNNNNNNNNNNFQGRRRGGGRGGRGRGNNQNFSPFTHINTQQSSVSTSQTQPNPFAPTPQTPQTPFSSSHSQILDSTPTLPTHSGFKPHQRNLKVPPAYLEEESASYTSINRQPDPWDVSNQQELLRIEQLQYSGVDLETLYKKMQEMREFERKQMEDKGLVDKQNVRKNLKDAIAFIGTCNDMCPTFERVRRSYELDTKPQERGSNGYATRELAVKAFSRPAAGQPPPLPSDVRPPKVLVSTLNYLIENVVPQLPKSHTFLWDRTRSIRQDFTYQNYIGPEAILCNELIARIHIVSLHIMLTSDVEYSKQQELEQFNKTLQTLSELYAANRKLDPSFRSSNEPEFRAYQLLSHIDDTETLMHIQALPLDVLKDSRLQLALTLRSLVQHTSRNNQDNALNLFASFFNSLVKNISIPYLCLCLLETNFGDIRSNALASMAHAYHSRGNPYIVSRLTSMLGFDNDLDTVSFCTDYGLKVVDDAQAGQCIVVTIDPKNLTPSVSSVKTYKSVFIDARKGSKKWSACIYNATDIPTNSTKPFVSLKAAQAMQELKPIGTGFSNNTVIGNIAASTSLKFSAPQSTVQLGNQNQSTSLFGGFNPTYVSSTQKNILSSQKQPNISQIQSVTPEVSTLEKPPPTQQTSFSFERANSNAPEKTTPALSFSAPSSSATFSNQPSYNFNPSTTPFISTKPIASSLFQNKTPETSTLSLEEPQKQIKSLFSGSSKLNINFDKTKEDVTQISNKLPQPPIVIKKPKPKYTYDDNDVNTETKKLLRAFVVRALRENVVPKAWKQVQEERADNIMRKNEACKSEMKDMVHELLVEEAMTAKAKQLNTVRLKRLAITCISKAAYQSVLRVEEKKRRKEEYLRIKNQLGRPRIFSSPTSVSNGLSKTHVTGFGTKETGNVDDSTKLRISDRLNNSIPSEKQITEKINQAQQISNRLWTPLDLATLSLPKLERTLKSQVHLYGTKKVSLSCFCRDWDSIVGKWIKTKFQLEGPGICSKSGTTVLEMQQLRDDDFSYRNLIQLAFVCGLDDDGRPLERNSEECVSQYDAAALKAILKRVIPNSLFKVQLLIISWTDLSELQMLNLLKINDLKKDLASINFCSIPNTSPDSQGRMIDPSQKLEDAIESMVAQFSALPSIRGQQSRDRDRIERQELRKERHNQELLKNQKLLDSAQEQRFQHIQSMGWLNQFSSPQLGVRNKRKRIVANDDTVNRFPDQPLSFQRADHEHIETSRPNKETQLLATLAKPSQIFTELSSSQQLLSKTPSSSSQFHSDFEDIKVPKSVRELQELTASVLKRPKVNQV